MEFDTKTLILQCIKLSTQKAMDLGKVVIEAKLINETMNYFHVEYNFALKCIKELEKAGIIKRDNGFIYCNGYEITKDLMDIVI